MALSEIFLFGARPDTEVNWVYNNFTPIEFAKYIYVLLHHPRQVYSEANPTVFYGFTLKQVCIELQLNERSE